MSGPDADALGAVRSALRAGIGCDTTAAAPHSAEERARCAQRFGANARAGPAFIDTIPAEKRAYYDAVQAAYQAARDPAHPLMRDANGEVRPWGHGPGLGCGMKFGGPPPKPDHRGFVEKIKGDGGILADIGPLKCGIILPQGSLTPELGIAPP